MFVLKCEYLKSMNLTFPITITNAISITFLYCTVHVIKMMMKHLTFQGEIKSQGLLRLGKGRLAVRTEMMEAAVGGWRTATHHVPLLWVQGAPGDLCRRFFSNG